ncbi:MAG: CBS domain-containing protein [Thermodesulfobacteriota bacterium]
MLQAKDIMSREVITVTSHTSVKDLAQTLALHQISGAPVVDDSGKVIGVVTESDLIDQSKKVHIPTVITILDSVFYLENPDKMEQEMKKIAGSMVGDICSSSPTLLAPDTPLDEIATIMAEQSIHTLPVVEDNRIVGIIGKRDIIRTIINS